MIYFYRGILMKKIIVLIAIILITLLFGCTKDNESTANNRFDEYIKNWTEQKFDQMYSMLTKETQKTYSTEQFVDRYQKIYDDLGISDLKIDYKKLDKEALNTAAKEGKATVTFKVSMESVAGPISFDYEATLIQEGEEEKQNWFVEWNPGFIFPEIKDGGKIHITTTSPTRGQILDRNKMPLATNDTVYQIGIVPEKLGANREANIKKIASLLDLSVDFINEQLNADWVKPDVFVPLKKVQKAKSDILNQLWQIDGVMGDEVTGRVYPAGEAAAHLVGYIGKITAEELENKDPGTYNANDVIGKRGLEQLFEEKLRGEKGVTITIEKDDEEITLAEKPVKDGENIELTIDIDVQEHVYNTFHGDAGTAAVINPQTGETLALASSPAFDPNEMAYGISQNKLNELQEDPDQPILNRFAATFAPGSSIKPISAAIGLQNGTIKPGEGITIKGKDWSNGKGWGDYKVHRVSESNGPVDIVDALVRSDNIYFAMKAVEMGSEKFVNGLKQFGVGEDLPFIYPITGSTVSSNGKIDNEVLLANTSYGQGEIEFSSLHLAMAYSAFVNDGTIYKPTLLASEKIGQIWKKELLSADNAKLIREALRNVVKNGTGRDAEKGSFAVSGKTGTAELKMAKDQSGNENGWFVGYPTDNPNVLVAMMIENVQNRGGSHYTAGKVGDIFKEIVQ